MSKEKMKYIKMKKLLILLLCVPLIGLGQVLDIPVFGNYEWVSENPIDLGTDNIKGFTLYNEYIKDKWNSEGVMFDHFSEGDIRVYPSSFDYMIFDSDEEPHLLLKITFSAGLLKEGVEYKIYYKILGDTIELRYNNQKSIYYKNE